MRITFLLLFRVIKTAKNAYVHQLNKYNRIHILTVKNIKASVLHKKKLFFLYD